MFKGSTISEGEASRLAFVLSFQTTDQGTQVKYEPFHEHMSIYNSIDSTIQSVNGF